MWEIARKNRYRSMVLLMLMGVILVGLGYIFGGAFIGGDGAYIGIVFALLLYFILLLVAFAGGKTIMLRMGNAKEADKIKHQQLYNIVEEMRLAAGMPFMPKVYVIEDPAPNAFAAGMTPKNSVVAVTTGLLEMSNRDELQGVVAHEISHIINRDIRYMTIATIMVASVAIMSHIFLRTMFYSSLSGGGGSRGGGGGKGQIIMLIVALVFAIIAPILIQMLYFSLSRKREYLADASAARLTRYPEGLASALEKIGKSTMDLKGAGKANAPMYIANPLKGKGKKVRNLSSTHPPLENRIKILRAMGNGHSLLNYQQAYQSVTQKKSSVIPSSTIANETKG